MEGHKVLVIGGSSGIGRALAKQLRNEGAEVIIASKSAAEKKDILKDIDCLQESKFLSFDITKEDEITELLEEVGELNHIAITVKSPLIVAPFLELDTQDARDAFETKLWGQYNVAKLAYKQMKKNGSITFTSGTLGNYPHEGFSTLSMINGAIESLTKIAALELAPVRVNAVCPGFKTLKELDDKIPLGLGSDTQMSNPYIFLMNDSYITGTTIVTDGGASLISV